MAEKTPSVKDLISLRQVSEKRLILGRNGRGASRHALREWACPKKGCVTRSGTVVLRTWRIGKDLFTTQASVDEFNAARTLARETRTEPEQPAPVPNRTQRANQRHAEKILRKHGILS